MHLRRQKTRRSSDSAKQGLEDAIEKYAPGPFWEIVEYPVFLVHAEPEVEPSQYGTMPPLPSFLDILGPSYLAHLEKYDLF
jgi:hypothetical protein